MTRARFAALAVVAVSLGACEEPLPPEVILPEIPFELTYPNGGGNGNLYLDDPQGIGVRTESYIAIDSVVARVGPLRDTLSYSGGDKGGGRNWSGSLTGADSLSPGEYELEVVAFGTDGSRGKVVAQLVRDPRPHVELLEPAGPHEAVPPVSRVRVTCRDPERGDCADVRVLVSKIEGTGWIEIGRGTTAIDTMVDWFALSPRPGTRYIEIQATSLSGRSLALDPRYSFTVASMEGLVPLDTVVGRIEDVDGARILSRGCDPSAGGEGGLFFSCDPEAGGVRLRITDRVTGAELVSPGLTYGGAGGTSVSMLTSVGAMTNEPTGYDFAPRHFVNMGVLGDLRVAGHFAVFTHERQVLLRDHRASPGETAWLRRVARDTSSGYTYPNVDVAPDGAVLFTMNRDSAVVLYRDGQLDTIAEHGHLVAFTGDGGIVYSRPTGSGVDSPYDVVLVRGPDEEVIGQIDEYWAGQILAANGWVAFRGKSNTTDVTGWIRSPSGEVVPMPAGSSWFRDIAPDGRVLFGMDFYLDRPGPHLFDPATLQTTHLGDYAEAVGFANGEVWVSIGRYLFRPE